MHAAGRSARERCDTSSLIQMRVYYSCQGALPAAPPRTAVNDLRSGRAFRPASTRVHPQFIDIRRCSARFVATDLHYASAVRVWECPVSNEIPSELSVVSHSRATHGYTLVPASLSPTQMVVVRLGRAALSAHEQHIWSVKRPEEPGIQICANAR